VHGEDCLDQVKGHASKLWDCRAVRSHSILDWRFWTSTSLSRTILDWLHQTSVEARKLWIWDLR